MRRILSSVLVLLFIAAPFTFAEEQKVSDKDIRAKIIAESIAAYPGNCPCPYNLARNGSRCGKRSAYSRGGGYSPMCYESDVTDEMVKKYREKHSLE